MNDERYIITGGGTQPSCVTKRKHHEKKRENKPSSGYLRIAPCSRRVSGFTPREAAAMIMSCEGMVADPVDSTDSPTFVRIRACSAAVASASRAAGSCQAVSTEFEAFSLQNIKNTAFWYSIIAGKKERMGPPPSLGSICNSPNTSGPVKPRGHTTPLRHLTKAPSLVF